MKKVAVLGCGRLGTLIAGALAQGRVEGVALWGVFGRTQRRTHALAEKLSCPAADSIASLLAFGPDYVIEAAAGQVVRQYAVAVLAGGADLIALSTGVFSDPVFYEQVEQAAVQYDRRVHLVPGVVGGFDIMAAARLMGPVEVSFTKRKHPRASGEGDPALRTMADFCSGNAGELYRRYPDHMNVAVSVALATNGVEDTPASVEPVRPGENVSFTTQLSGSFGDAEIRTELGTIGPDLAAWSALAVLERLTRRIVL